MHERDFQATRFGPATAPPASMKYLFLLAAVAAAYFLLARNTPAVAVAKAVTASEAAPLTTSPRAPAAAPAEARTNALKSPIDRTHAVLDQVKPRNGAGEF